MCHLRFLNAYMVKTIPQQETFQTCIERVGSQTGNVTGSVKSDYFGLNPLFHNNEAANFSFIVSLIVLIEHKYSSKRVISL